MKILFAATGSIAVPTLEKLNEMGLVRAVLTTLDERGGRGGRLIEPPIKIKARELGIECYQMESLRTEARNVVSKLGCDTLLSFCYGKIFGPKFLSLFEHKYNIHPSLLPKYRGANPIQRAIINGDKQTGICTMITELELDCGDVCMKEVIDIPEDMTCVDLFDVISEKSPQLIEKTLFGLVNNSITPQKQSEDGVCMANKLTKEEPLIDWSKSAQEIHNLVRGIYKFPSAYFIHNGKIIKVLQTRVLNGSGKCGEFVNISKEGIEVACGKGSILLIKVKPEGKGEMFARDWANGLHK